jgi:hypothetical protein
VAIALQRPEYELTPITWAAAAVVWLYAIMFLFINDEVRILTVHLLFAHPADMPVVDEAQVS